MDGGGFYSGYKESNFTMDIAEKVKDLLEDKGLKVKMTHSRGEISESTVMNDYNEHGRAIIPNEVKSKYTFSIHINKNQVSSVRGLEVYTAANINYDFAKSIAATIKEYTKIDYSKNKIYKMFDGVYTHNFSESEITNSLAGYEEKKYTPYNITTNSNYLFMIRETGGFMTGAYIDNSNPEKVGLNPYYNSNVGNETYLTELCYLSNSEDLKILIDEKENFARAIADSIKKELNL